MTTTYIFRASKQPSPKEVHCLWSHLTDKSHQGIECDYRIETNGRLVNVTTALPIDFKDVELQSVAFTALRKSPAPSTWSYGKGDRVIIQGRMSYSVHGKVSRKDVCPVDPLGRVRPEQKATFMAYLEKNLGISMQAVDVADMAFSWEDQSNPNDKIWLNDVIHFAINTVITDASIFNTLASRAIGRRRAYGFGTVLVAEHFAALQEPAAPEDVEAIETEEAVA